jgi:hypothetical protein
VLAYQKEGRLSFPRPVTGLLHETEAGHLEEGECVQVPAPSLKTCNLRICP